MRLQVSNTYRSDYHLSAATWLSLVGLIVGIFFGLITYLVHVYDCRLAAANERIAFYRELIAEIKNPQSENSLRSALIVFGVESEEKFEKAYTEFLKHEKGLDK